MCDDVALFKCLGCSKAVVQCVGPDAVGRVNGNAAVGGARCGFNDAPGPGCAGIDVAGAQGAAGCGDSGNDGTVVQMAGFGDGAGQCGC